LGVIIWCSRYRVQGLRDWGSFLDGRGPRERQVPGVLGRLVLVDGILRVYGSGCRVQDVGFRGVKIRKQDLKCRV
jgi:hypothetical protein